MCDNALITGFGYRKQPVTRGIVKEIIRDFDGLKWPSAGRWWFPALSALTMLLIAMAWLLPSQDAVLGRIRSLATVEQRKPDNVVVRVVPAAVVPVKESEPDEAISVPVTASR